MMQTLDVTLQLCKGSNTATWYRGELRAARYEGNQRTVNALPLRTVPPISGAGKCRQVGQTKVEDLVLSPLLASSCRTIMLSRRKSLHLRRETCDTTSQVYEGKPKQGQSMEQRRQSLRYCYSRNSWFGSHVGRSGSTYRVFRTSNRRSHHRR